jgi:hypothetical protein
MSRVLPDSRRGTEEFWGYEEGAGYLSLCAAVCPSRYCNLRAAVYEYQTRGIGWVKPQSPLVLPPPLFSFTSTLPEKGKSTTAIPFKKIIIVARDSFVLPFQMPQPGTLLAKLS